MAKGKKLRFGVVGLGNMGSGHSRNLAGGDGDAPGANFQTRGKAAGPTNCCLGAVCDIVADKAKSFGEELGVPYYTDAQDMYDDAELDAVIVAVPHYWHTPLVIRAARSKLHVLCEKPLAVTVGEARAMIAECRKRRVAFGAMLQQRTRGEMKKMHELIARGRIGEVFRIQMICSNWYRSQAYYDSGSWRGTWDGEGGGVLINQAPHSLDLFQWMAGMPKRVLASVSTRCHDIEVEDTANAICEYGDGKIGYIYATTAEAPGMERLIVCGEKGTIISEGGKLRLGKLKKPLSEYIQKNDAWGRPETEWKDVSFKPTEGQAHLNVTKAFADHVLKGRDMVATAEEAINELELSNAIYVAGFRNKAVDLPVDAAEIDRLIAKLQRERSTGKGGEMRKAARKDIKKLDVNIREQ